MGLLATNPDQPALRPVLRGVEYFTLAFGTIVGVGWMIVIEDWLTRGGSVGAMLGFLLGGLGLVPIVAVYGRLAERMPESASEIAYTAAVFPRSVSFAAGWTMTFTYLIVCPYEAVAVGRVASYLFPDLNQWELYRIAGQPVYLPHVLLGLGAIAVITFLNLRGIRFSAVFQNWTTFGLLAIFAVFATLGLWRANVANLPPYFASEETPIGPLLATLAVLQVVPYFMNGFETIPKCAEEAAPGFGSHRFRNIMYLAVAVGTLFYVTVVAVVALLHPWQELAGADFATAIAFERAFGWPWLVQLIMLGVMLSLLKVFNGSFLAATRLLYALGRRDLLGARLGAVDERYQTPALAIVLVGTFTALASLFGRAVLVPISEVGSLTCTAGWLSACLAYCAGAGGSLSWPARLAGIAASSISLVLVAIAAAGFGRYHWLALGSWGALGLGLWLWQGGRRPTPT